MIDKQSMEEEFKTELARSELQKLMDELSFVTKVLIKTTKEQPSLDKFNEVVRGNAIKQLKEIYPKVFEEHYRDMKLIFHYECHDDFLPRLILHILISRVDPLFDHYATEVEKVGRESVRMKDPDFSKLKLSPKLLNMIPSTTEEKQHLYELCIKWIVKIETNVDLIQRALTYGYIKREIDGENILKKTQDNLPQTLILKSSFNNFLNGIVDQTIDKVFNKSVEKISSKVNKAVISFIVTMIFGATVVGIGGFMINFVELPFDVNLNIVEWFVDPIIRFVKKRLNIGNQDLVIYLLQEAISQVETSNTELEKHIKGIAQFHYGDKKQKLLLENLKELIDDIVKNRRRTSNVRSQEEMAKQTIAWEEMKGEFEGWVQVKDFGEIIEVESSEDQDEFTVVKIKDNCHYQNHDSQDLNLDDVYVLDEVIDDENCEISMPSKVAAKEGELRMEPTQNLSQRRAPSTRPTQPELQNPIFIEKSVTSQITPSKLFKEQNPLNSAEYISEDITPSKFFDEVQNVAEKGALKPSVGSKGDPFKQPATPFDINSTQKSSGVEEVPREMKKSRFPAAHRLRQPETSSNSTMIKTSTKQTAGTPTSKNIIKTPAQEEQKKEDESDDLGASTLF